MYRIIKKFDNVELVELKIEEEYCCFVETFAVKESEISNAIVSYIEKSGADYIISADGGCLMNIASLINAKT